MRRLFRAPGMLWRLAVAVYAVVACGSLRASGQGALPAHAPEPSELYRRVKTFDFDERPLGNFEDTPMYWQRLTGPGLPAYSRGEFDDDFGHRAPPSFLLTIRGGSVAYEYTHADLAISPKSDYIIEGYVLAEGLDYAGALVLCYLADQGGERIPGSERISELVRSVAGSDPGGWRRLEILVPGEYPNAHTMRLQLWVLQTYAYESPGESTIDPIMRQEVDARVWFDDITIIRMPRVRLWFSNPGGIVKPGAQEVFHVEIHNATLAALQTELTVEDAAGNECFRKEFDLPPRATEEYKTPVPGLPAGMYQAHVRLSAQGKLLVHRQIRFAVLPDLFTEEVRYRDFGLDLGRWADGDPAGASELITTLGCGAVKIGLPMIDSPRDEQEVEYLRRMRGMVRHLALSEIESTGVLLSPVPPGRGGRRSSTFRLLMGATATDERLGPVFAHSGGHLASWQLGQEPVELSAPGGWTAAAIEQIRDKLKRFVAAPQLVVPRAIYDAAPAADQLGVAPVDSATARADEPTDWATLQRLYACSYWLPAEIPTRAIPWHLAFWNGDGAGRGIRRWLSLGLEREPCTSPEDELLDMARRVVLASAVGPDRLYVPAPFELSRSGGAATWQPTDEYIPLRVLLRCLSGARAAAAMNLPHDAVAILFSAGQHHTLVVWTWLQEPREAAVELYVGRQAQALDLSGARQRLDMDGPLARVPLSRAPLVIENVDASLLLLQDSFQVTPAFIQLHRLEPRPVLTLRNTYPMELAGRIELQPPLGWSVAPTHIRVLLAAGETLAQPLDFLIPPRTIATERVLSVDVSVRRPDAVDLHFDIPLEIGLEDVIMNTTAWWEGDDLVVEQSVQNLARFPLSFNGFCQAPERPQHEGVLLDIPPGESRLHNYRLPKARDLVGTRLWMGIQEINGLRTLDQLVPVPR